MTVTVKKVSRTKEVDGFSLGNIDRSSESMGRREASSGVVINNFGAKEAQNEDVILHDHITAICGRCSSGALEWIMLRQVGNLVADEHLM